MAGLFFSSAAELLSIGYLIWGIRTFTGSINIFYNQQVYSEKDNVGLGFCATLVFIFFQVISLTQLIDPIITITNLAYLYASKLALVSFFLAISHLRLLLYYDMYKKTLLTYFHINPVVRSVLFNPIFCLIVVYLNALVLNFPLFLGQQFLQPWWKLVLVMILNLVLFWGIFTIIFKKTIDLLAVVIMEEIDNTTQPVKHSMNKPINFFLLLCALISGSFLLITKFRLFVFGLSLFFIGGVFLLLIHTLLYVLSLGVSFMTARNKPDLSKSVVFISYWFSTIKGITHAILPALILVMLVFVLLSIKPKPLHYQNPDMVNAVLDPKGDPLFIEPYEGNRCIPVSSKNDIDTIFLNQLYRQEDRSFSLQRSFVPHLSNWNGLSFGGFRMLSGGAGTSNINNQLIKNLAYSNSARTPRDLARKFSEATCSYQLSVQLPPDDIVNYYINTVSFCGGINTRGLYAASFQIFKKVPADLNPLQCLFLVRTLTMGSKYWLSSTKTAIRYDSIEQHEAEIKTELLEYANKHLQEGLISLNELDFLEASDLNFSVSNKIVTTTTTTREFLKKQIPLSEDKKTYYSSLTDEKQKMMVVGVKKFENQFRPFLKNGKFDLYYAAIAVEVGTGKIIGHYGGKGNTDLVTLGNGQPMASLIKPFVLQELILDQNEDIQLFDGPIKHKRTPHNFNNHWSYRFMGVPEILKYSPNAPMVNILEVTNPIELYKKVEARFVKMDISPDPDLNFSDKTWITLNYPLGSRKMRLIDITQAYQTLLNDGKAIKLYALQNIFDPITNKTECPALKNGKRVYHPNETHVITDAMKETIYEGTASTLHNILPRGFVYYAKTGTSENATKCYCVLSDGEILIVTYVNYGTIVNGRLELNNVPPVPFQNNKTATVLSACLYNELISKE
ncbi:MAG: transglycosylase domain-containing protein [Prolixibacteraceae bacterium]|nr:transglycosylase domain-containing protein [Prolixibacteraceae bacterium]